MPATVTLTTDFGTADGYAAELAGAVWRVNPDARVFPATHAIPPQDVPAAAEVLPRLAAAFPPGTVHVAVVDPGVGSDRAVVAVRVGSQRFVAPDNGVLSRVLPAAGPAKPGADCEAVRLTDPRYWRPHPSVTFHGRDLMAPVAGHLTLGVPLAELGEPIPPDTLVRLPTDAPRTVGGTVHGAVVKADRFGNLVTNVPAAAVPEDAAVEIRGRTVAVVRCYADVGGGEPLALVGSDGRLEVAVRDGSAAAVLGAGRGETLAVRPG